MVWIVAWENSWHFTTPPLVSGEYNYVWETNAGTLYWWWVTTQIWVIHLIGWSKFSTNQKHDSDLGCDALSEWNFMRRRYFAGKPVVASPNVGCFLGLWEKLNFEDNFHCLIMISLKLFWKDKMWDCLLTTLLEEIVMALLCSKKKGKEKANKILYGVFSNVKRCRGKLNTFSCKGSKPKEHEHSLNEEFTVKTNKPTNNRKQNQTKTKNKNKNKNSDNNNKKRRGRNCCSGDQ